MRSHRSPAASAAKNPSGSRPPALGQDLAKTEEPSSKVSRAAPAMSPPPHRGLPDPLMGQKYRELLRMRAQVRQVHASRRY